MIAKRIRTILPCKTCGNTCIPITTTVYQSKSENVSNSFIIQEVYTMRCRCGNLSRARSLDCVIKRWNNYNERVV